ncbi:MAG TPA: hypothetical protein VGD07_16935 [Methylomirabilota bacterium]
MKIAKLEHLHADAGQRNFDFLKLTADDGLVGWSEYNESFGGLGVSAVIDGLASLVVGKDPRAYEAIVANLYAVRRQAAGGVVQQAIGAVENALLDLRPRPSACPSTSCWAARCATASGSTGRTAAPIGWRGRRRCRSRRCGACKIA